MKNKTLVFGTSLKEERYSNKAIKRLRERDIPVVAYGLKKGDILDVAIDDELKHYESIDTVTLYLNPKRQQEYYDYIMSLNPRRVIFNPGTENDKFIDLLNKNGIQSEEACTLVLLATNQY